jgi:putative ABC transport system permease protein
MYATQFVRLVRRNPGFFVSAILTLALGIGANTAVFSIVHNVLFRPLPYRDSGRLAVITGGVRNVTSRMPVAPADFIDFKTRSRSFEDIAAAELWQANLTTPNGAEPLRGMRVTANLFDVLGVMPAVGTSFTAQDDAAERKVAIISNGLWQRRFASDPSIAGRTVRLNGEPYTVIGVMPASFHFAPFWAPRMEVWTPLVMTPERKASRGGQSLRLFARLRTGVDVPSASAEIQTIAAAVAKEHPGMGQRTARVEGLLDLTVGDTRRMLWMLLSAVGLVLLLACVNVANLLLSRAVTRHREMAVRHALGGARNAIIRQLLGENLWLALAGGVAGLALGRWTLDAIVAMLPEDILPRQAELGFQFESLIFAGCVSLLAILAFGLVPAIYQSAAPALDALRGGRGTSASARQKSIMRAGLAAQIALAFVLLTGTGLLLRSFSNLLSIDPGFDPHNVVIAPVSTTGAGIRKAAFYEGLFRRIRSIPGVEAASLINHAPIAGDEWGTQFEIESRPVEKDNTRAVYRVAFPDYFRTLRIPLIAGRDISPDDREGRPLVAVVNHAFQKRYFQGTGVIGKRFRRSAGEPWTTIVGVVHDVKQQAWTAPVEPEIYFAFLQDPNYLGNRSMFNMTVVARGTGPLAESIREQVRNLNSIVAVSRVETMEDAISHAVARPRLALMLLGWFAAIALILAAIGVYGTASFMTNERNREIGIRIAVGAQPQQIYRLLGKDAGRVVGAGVAVGLGAALAMSAGFRSLLYQVKPDDLLTYVSVSLMLAVACLTAAMIPARRASRVDPVSALRDE